MFENPLLTMLFLHSRLGVAFGSAIAIPFSAGLGGKGMVAGWLMSRLEGNAEEFM